MRTHIHTHECIILHRSKCDMLFKSHYRVLDPGLEPSELGFQLLMPGPFLFYLSKCLFSRLSATQKHRVRPEMTSNDHA